MARVTVTGATGLIGRPLVAALLARGDEVTVLSRDPARARKALGAAGPAAGAGPGLESVAWDLMSEPAPAAALAGRDAVVHLAGENVAQRWTPKAREAIRESRVTGTRHVVAGLSAAGDDRPATLVSASAVGYYGARGEEPIDEDAPPGEDFLAGVCVAWEREAAAAEDLGVRVSRVRTGVVLDKQGGALAKMLPPFRLGIGGPVAGGRQYVPWIHIDDVVGIMLSAVDQAAWAGPVNASAPEPVTNRELSRTLGRVLHRPAIAPVPAAALRLLYGDMAQVVTTGVRAVPARALVRGYEFRYRDLDGALRAALG